MIGQSEIEATNAEYHRIIDNQISLINENMRNIFKYIKIHRKWETEKVANVQLKTSNIIVMKAIQELFLLLQNFKHHSISFAECRIII